MNNTFLTDDTNAVLLLCGVFGKERDVKPLTQTEYNALMRWLILSKMRPGDLLQKDPAEKAAQSSGVERDRLVSLLGRGVQLGFSVEEWQRSGLWVISRSDSDYPTRFKKHLKEKAPPLLFGAGERSFLSGGGLAIVGSRNIDEAGEAFAKKSGELCAEAGLPVVSGGARGVDRLAMSAALDCGGAAIGILAENLQRKSLERNARYAISDGCLLLLSACHPTARFTVGNAMARNKLIYAMADFGLVVSADHKKGGTWAGAEEELKRPHARPVFVRTGVNVPSGNTRLLELGAVVWPKVVDPRRFKETLLSVAGENRGREASDLFEFSALKNAGEPLRQRVAEEPVEYNVSAAEKPLPATVYEAVLPLILVRLENPLTLDDLAEELGVLKKQLSIWLKQAVGEKKIKKISRPVRYQKRI